MNLTFKCPWVLFLDADERMTPAWRQEMAEYEKIDEDHCSDLDMEIHEHLQVVEVGSDLKRKGFRFSTEGAVYQVKARLEHHDTRSLESPR